MKKLLLFCALVLTGTLNTLAWQTDPAINDQITPNGYDLYAYSVKVNQNGVTYIYFQTPAPGGQTMRLQILDKDGTPKFDSEGLIISNEPNASWTEVNQTLMVDRDGNAIISVRDWRKAPSQQLDTYTIYKINEQGEILWSTTLNGGETYADSGTACMNMVQTLDGGYVFCHMVYSYVGVPTYLVMEKLDKDGTSLWRQLLYDENGGSYSWPYMVDGGDNMVMLLFCKGAGQDVYCRLIDVDGTAADDDMLVTYGAWGSNPSLYTAINVQPGPDNSVVMGWRSAESDSWSNHLTWIKNDLTFAFASGMGGTPVSTDEYNSRDVPDFYYDQDDHSFYCVFRVYNQAYQQWKGLYMQRMGEDGDLLWGPEGKAIIELQETDQYQNVTVKDAGDGRIAVFYQHMGSLSVNDPVENLMTIYDKDGNIVQEPVNFATNDMVKNSLETSPLIDGQYYLTWWTVSFGMNEQVLYMQRVNLDGTTGIAQPVMNLPAQADHYYTLNGMRLDAPQKGLNIVNGKKIIVK